LLSTNKKTLDNLYKRERLKPFSYFFIIILLIAIFLYLLFHFQSQYALEQSSNIKSNITAKIKGSAASRSNSICSYELKSGEILALGCPNKIFIMGSEIKLIKITKPSGYVYYEVEDELITKLNSITHPSSGTPNGAP
jgi:hypothetical protein